MDHLFNDIRAKIPANKFYPPVLDSTRYLPRKRLLQKLIQGNGRRKIILIEAQAGQGKTVLAAQFLGQVNAPFGWYQVGPEDGDPVLFLNALLACLMNALPGFRSPLLEEMTPKGEISPLELPRYANFLLSDLDRHLKGDFWVVFDDLHLLEGSEASAALLEHILQTAPPKLRFLLTARRPMGLDLPVRTSIKNIFLLENQDLAMTRTEAADLFRDVLNIPFPASRVRELHEATEGWAMGLVLVAIRLERNREAPIQVRGDASLRTFFRAEVFAQITLELQGVLLRLSLLEEIPVLLAKEITSLADIGNWLIELSRRNFFVRSLDNDGFTFRFHHLFRDFLRDMAATDLPAGDRSRIHRLCAEYYLHRDDPEKALRHFLQLPDYQAVEKVLEKHGFHFVALNRTGTLYILLDHLQEETIFSHPWMTYFSGMIKLEKDPPQALPFLEKARELFSGQRNIKGELVALAQLIQFHCTIDCQYHLGPELLRRADEIFPSVRSSLDDQLTIFVAMHLSHGFSIMQVVPEKARYYSDLALSLARKNEFLNLEAFARFNIAMQNAFFGNHQRMLKEIENAFHLLRSPRVSTVNRMLLRFLQLNYLAVEGEFENFLSQEKAFRRETRESHLFKTVAGPFLLVNKIDAAIAGGRWAEAHNQIEEGLSWGGPAENPHLRSQFLHYQALVHSLDGDKDVARAAAAESQRLRRASGGEIWSVASDMIIGAALSHADREDEADILLTRAIEESKRFGQGFLRAGAHANRAFLILKAGDIAEALQDVRECLRCLKENDYVHFFSWTPLVMKSVLKVAVEHGIEIDYARQLSRERLGLSILPDGQSIPLLKINTFGGLSIVVESRVVLKAEELTQAQREMLALLISSPGLKRCQEKIQAVLWPDSAPEKSRANFDNLLMRLRKTMSTAIKPHAVKNYLSLQKGILCLENCRVDAAEFVRKARKGLKHVRSKEFWQAGNAFYSAHNLWKGTFLPSGPSAEAVQTYRDELERLFIESSCRWAKILTETGRVEEADTVLGTAVKHDPTNDDLVRYRYQIQLQADNTARALKILKQYKVALQHAEYSSEEIAEILASVSASSS